MGFGLSSDVVDRAVLAVEAGLTNTQDDDGRFRYDGVCGDGDETVRGKERRR